MRHPPRLRPYWPARRERADKAASATVETLLKNMDPVRREALLLHRIEKLTYAQISERLSVSRREVISLIADAVAELTEGLVIQRNNKDR